MNHVLVRLYNTCRDTVNAANLKAQAARGGLWVGAGSGLEQILRITRNIILTRILAPEAFGLMAIVIAVNAAFQSFTEIGIKESIIQNPRGCERTFLNGAWWLALVRSVMLYAIVFIFAPSIARFYDNPELSLLMRVAFISLLLNGVLSSNAYVAIKNMDFRRWVVLFHGGGVCGIVLTVILALFIQNVWALVIGFLTEAVARCVFSYVYCPFRPGLTLERESFRSLLKFARGMFGLPILTFIFMRTDIFVVGKFFPMSELGLYSMASLIAWAPFNFITSVTGRIMMPLFSKKQQDNAWINSSTLKITTLIAGLGLPLFFFAVLYGSDFLACMYGARYAAVAVPFAIVFATAMLRTISQPIATVYIMTGRPELHRFFTAIRAVLIIVLIVPAVTFYGLTGAAAAAFSAMLVGYVVQVRRMRATTGLSLSRYCSLFVRCVAVSCCVVIVWAVTKNYFIFTPIINILPGVAGCLITYVLMLKFVIVRDREVVSTVT